MIIKNASLETVCGYTSKLPKNTKPEIAFAGKSNVGKSSLINALMNRKALARTSGQPGKTQTINFYNINDELYLTDLPGYGFAKVSQKEKEKWGTMIENYLNSSEQLRAVFLLVDIRHEPSANDKMMYEWMVYQAFIRLLLLQRQIRSSAVSFRKQLKVIRLGLNTEKGAILIPFSAETKQGRDEIWNLVDQILASSGETDEE